MSYADDHAAAHADVADAGAAVTYTKVTPGVYDPTTDSWTPTVNATVPAVAMEVGKNPVLYQALGLVSSEAPTLLTVADVYGTVPVLGSTVVWGGNSYTTRSVVPFSPDGTVLTSRVVVAR